MIEQEIKDKLNIFQEEFLVIFPNNIKEQLIKFVLSYANTTDYGKRNELLDDLPSQFNLWYQHVDIFISQYILNSLPIKNILRFIKGLPEDYTNPMLRSLTFNHFNMIDLSSFDLFYGKIVVPAKPKPLMSIEQKMVNGKIALTSVNGDDDITIKNPQPKNFQDKITLSSISMNENGDIFVKCSKDSLHLTNEC